MVCLCLAAFYSIGLTLTGLNSGFLIGLMTGLLSFIPFVGAASGFLVAAIVAINAWNRLSITFRSQPQLKTAKIAA